MFKKNCDNKNLKKKLALIIFVCMFLISVESIAAINSYVAASSLEVNGEIRQENISDFKRTFLKGSSVLIDEEGLVEIQKYNKINLYKLVRKSGQREMLVNDILNYGFPVIIPESLKLKSIVRLKMTLKYEEEIVPIDLSYKVTEIKKLNGKEVAHISITLIGIGKEVGNGDRMKWAGMGEEIWDVETKKPLMRTMELRYGRSFVSNIHLRLSYAESILNE